MDIKWRHFKQFKIGRKTFFFVKKDAIHWQQKTTSAQKNNDLGRHVDCRKLMCFNGQFLTIKNDNLYV